MKAVTVFAAVVAMLLLLYGCGGKPEAEPSTEEKTAEAAAEKTAETATTAENATPAIPKIVQPSGNGTFYVGIADAAIDVKDVSKLEVTINALQLRQAGSGNITKIGAGIKAFDLMRLKKDGVTAFFGNETIPAGTYDQIRIFVGEVKAVYKGEETEAKLSSKSIKIDAEFEVPVNGTSSIVLDFQADQMLHITGQGRIIIAPVVQVNHAVGSAVNVIGSEMTIAGGAERIGKIFGMDVNGNMAEGIKIDAAASLSYENGRVSVVGGGAGVSQRILTGSVGNISNIGESSAGNATNGGILISKGGNPTNTTNPAGMYRTYRRVGNYSEESSSQSKYYQGKS